MQCTLIMEEHCEKKALQLLPPQVQVHKLPGLDARPQLIAHYHKVSPLTIEQY